MAALQCENDWIVCKRTELIVFLGGPFFYIRWGDIENELLETRSHGMQRPMCKRGISYAWLGHNWEMNFAVHLHITTMSVHMSALDTKLARKECIELTSKGCMHVSCSLNVKKKAKTMCGKRHTHARNNKWSWTPWLAWGIIKNTHPRRNEKMSFYCCSMSAPNTAQLHHKW